MKTKVLFLLFAMSSVALNCFAQDVPQPNNEPDAIFGGLTGDGGIKSGSVSASAYICQQVITIYIDWYAGYADIYVEDEDGNEVADDTIYVNGHASTQLNVSTLPSGTYTLYIKLRNGSIFSGSFQI